MDCKKNSKNSKYDPSKIHAGHRMRMNKAFVSGGAGSMYDHQLLELLLMHVIPRIDVNPIAHLLLNRFGSLSGVFNATERELMQVHNIGAKSAAAIKAAGALVNYINSDKHDDSKLFLDSNKKMDLFCAQYAKNTQASFFACFMGYTLRLMDIEEFTCDTSDEEIDAILWRALNRKGFLASLVYYCREIDEELNRMLDKLSDIYQKMLAWQFRIMDMIIIKDVSEDDTTVTMNTYRSHSYFYNLPNKQIIKLSLAQSNSNAVNTVCWLKDQNIADRSEYGRSAIC